jgi:hypothetical protein
MSKPPAIQAIEALAGGESALEVMRRIADASATDSRDGTASAELEESTRALQQAISRAELTQRLHKAMEEAASRDAASMEALRVAVCEFTLALREAGTTPEATLISLKDAVNRKSLPQFSTHAADRRNNQLHEEISTWCIKAYFQQDAACT